MTPSGTPRWPRGLAPLVLVLAACGASGTIHPSLQAAAGAVPHEATHSAGPDDAGASGAAPVRFIEDDYARARAEARARGVPLFVDTWAPWCHTCLSMRAFVFTDDRLRSISTRFVWLSIDTEREGNAALVTKLGVKVLPTLFVLDARDERVVLAWPGSLTARELVALLDDTRTGEGPTGPFAVDALIARQSGDGRLSECLTAAAREAPRMPPGTALADVLRSGIDCGRRLPSGAPERGRLADLAALAERVVSDPSQPILADDRSDLYDYLIGAYRNLGRNDDAKRLAAAWGSFLEQQAAFASSPPARAVFDAHRLMAYVAMGEPQRAIPMLEQSERDFPDDYNPPARLASAYFAMKNYDEALAAAKRALDRAYGPRKLRLWSLQADVLVAKGDTAGARASLRAAIDFARSVPLPEGYPKQLEAIEKRLPGLR
ncbi:MAG: thioredoxin family protein [Polyangiaceae bacterium]